MSALSLHRFTACSTRNGPGERAVVWVQGCAFDCPGCFNPRTHAMQGGTPHDPATLAAAVNRLPVRGVTLSGGEPLHQPAALLAFLVALDPGKDVLLYTGYTLAEILQSPARRAVLLACDAALMGRYDQARAHPYQGKELMVRTGRIRPDELQAHRAAEIVLHRRSGLLTGLPDRPSSPLPKVHA